MTEFRPVRTKSVLEHPYLDISLDTVADETGREFTYIHGTGPQIAYALPLWPDGTVTLLSQARYGLSQRSIEVPGGHCNPGEQVEDAARRELLEETGLMATKLREMTRFLVSIKIQQPVVLYLAEDLSEDMPAPDDDEDIELIRMPLDKAVDRALSGQVLHGPSVAAILTAAEIVRRRK